MLPTIHRLHVLCGVAALGLLPLQAQAAQVHYYEDGGPWNQRADGGPDEVVPGWYINLGLSGLRVELVEAAPTHLVVRHVLAGSPAEGLVQVGDHVIGAGGQSFRTAHQNGYGMEVFGARGPVGDFAVALEACQGTAGNGRLALEVQRAGETLKLELPIGQKYGAFGPNYPLDCQKSERIRRELLEYLLPSQQENGSFGDPVLDTFAPLALLASGEPQHVAAVERNARFHAATTKSSDSDGLINWRYMTAGIVLGEYYLRTGEAWLLPELEEVRDFLLSSQYMRLEQVNPQAKISHPDSYPADAEQQRGGWGHNPGFEGYGPIAMLTGQGLLTLSLIERCGIPVEREPIEAARAFLGRGAGPNGYVWYADSVAGERDWADMGRTGAAGIALALYNPPQDGTPNEAQARAMQHALVIGEHPESFPDTHGSPILGMGYTALAAHLHGPSFRRLMEANRWWFALAQCNDGSFYYQPNRDNSGYGADSRVSASAVTAFILSIPKGNLEITGRSRPSASERQSAERKAPKGN